MKTFFESVVVTFAMYTKIPMPKVNWDNKNMQYSLLIFPFVGILIAVVLYALVSIFHTYGLSPIFFAGVATAVSVMITGGIHLDGFCDTVDALSSHQDKEGKLLILQDPHVGAFAVIYTVAVLLLQFGAWHQIFDYRQYWLFVLVGFVISRIFTSFVIVTFPCAKKSGLAAIFAGYASKQIVRNILVLYFLVACACLLYFEPLVGAILIPVLLLTFLWFYTIVHKQFGGITGDLAGFFLVLCETGTLVVVAVLGGILA